MNPEQSAELALLMRDSLRRLTGRDLTHGLDTSAGVAAALATAPFGLVAHDAAKDPVFVYGNHTALDLFQRTWDDFTAMPSRLSAETVGRSERARMLRRARNKGFVDGYHGVRVSASGRRFEISGATLWNLVDDQGRHHGQAALLPLWTHLEDSAPAPGPAVATTPDLMGTARPTDIRVTSSGRTTITLAPARTTALPVAAGSTLLATRPDRPAVEIDTAAAPSLRRLTRTELDVLLASAADEGWNPGVHDAEAFWAADREGLWVVEIDGMLVGGAAAVRHDDHVGAIGMFLVRPELRGSGIGRTVLRSLLDGLGRRLAPGAGISLDAPVGRESLAAQFGFRASHRIMRMSGTGTVSDRGAQSAALRNLAAVPAHDVIAYDATYIGAERPDFLRHWIKPAGGLGIAAVEGGRLVGMGAVRRCRSGLTVGPLFADSPELADSMLRALSAHAAGQPLHLDVPASNSAAVELAATHGLTERSAFTRMVRGDIPTVPADEVYGVTAVALG
jgi:ribosomal protein S18 acetylase RimI-like enzyme